MKIVQLLVFAILISFSASAQVAKLDTLKIQEFTEENDTILKDPILLEEVIIHKSKLDPESKKQFLILQNRVYKVYPYAKIAAERLSGLNRNMAALNSNKEKRKYFKIVENYIENEFTDKLKKLSRKQGQVLVKLICRQTGQTTYDLIREQKSGWKAFWSNTTAKLFDINLKLGYSPYEVNEDFLIETILDRAFDSGRLVRQAPATPIDLEKVTNHWYSKASVINK
jgi:ABC-type transporter MlaC component